jgi:hypothetical protein
VFSDILNACWKFIFKENAFSKYWHLRKPIYPYKDTNILVIGAHCVAERNDSRQVYWSGAFCCLFITQIIISKRTRRWSVNITCDSVASRLVWRKIRLESCKPHRDAQSFYVSCMHHRILDALSCYKHLTPKIRSVTTFLIADLHTTFSTEDVCTFMICFRTKFYMPSSNYSLLIIIKNS